MERNGQLEQEVGTLGVVGPERERVVVLRRCDGEAVERERAIAGLTECASRTLDQLVVVAPGGPDELECGAPVVREHLGVVLGSPEAVDPLRDGAMLRARDRRGGSGRTTTSRTSACANANSLSPSSDERR